MHQVLNRKVAIEKIRKKWQTNKEIGKRNKEIERRKKDEQEEEKRKERKKQFHYIYF